MKKQLLYWLAFGLILTIGCKKETSFETGNNPSDGSLQADATGDCLPKTVNGAYVANTALVAATNTITVQVNVNVVGNFNVYTDTVNGYYFRATGTFTTLGAQNLILRGNGTPFSAGINNFVVHYDSTVCDIQVTVLPAGTGNAVFTLNGAGGSCTSATVAGTYIVGVPLSATTNTVTINTNVTTTGLYSITTTFQGMTFSANGAFTTTGPNTVILVGSGTPTTSGTNTVPLTVGTNTCSFVVNVGAGAAGSLAGGPGACAPINVLGTYTIGTALSQTANTATVTINVTTGGTYAITTDTVQGMYFNSSGNLTVGTTTVTLAGFGTPIGTAGTKTFTVKFGTSTCTFTVNLQGGTGGACVCTLQGAPNACAPFTVNGAYYVGTILAPNNTVTVQLNVTTPGTWNFSTNTVTGFSFTGSGSVAAGLQTITLNGIGTPTTQGPQTFTLSNGAGSTCTFVVPVLSTDYFPRVTGNNWSYEQDDISTDSLLRYVIAPTHSALGNTYNILFSNDGTGPDSSGYYRRSGTDYFEWFDAADYIGYTQPLWAEYIMVKDAPLNTEWVSQGFAGTTTGTPPQNLNIRFKYKIESRDLPVTFNTSINPTGVTYHNVIVVLEKFEAEVTPGVWTDITSQVGYFKSYYAKGIGFIKFEQFNAANVLQTQLELRRFQVF